MDTKKWKEILEEFRSGERSLGDVMERLKSLPYEDMGFVKIDHHRQMRCGFPEVIYGKGKSAGQLKKIIGRMKKGRGPILVTKMDEGTFREVEASYPEALFHSDAKAMTINFKKKRGFGLIHVVTAGTLDIPVAEEAALTAEVMGSRVNRIYDVGVAGIHRVLDKRRVLEKGKAVIAVAGMEGALPSVIGGLVSVPVIGVPTSVGYGSSFEGLSALLTMLNSCASGVTVVNIDNGFSAAVTATLINRKIEAGSKKS